jgi:hypothetical protein
MEISITTTILIDNPIACRLVFGFNIKSEVLIKTIQFLYLIFAMSKQIVILLTNAILRFGYRKLVILINLCFSFTKCENACTFKLPFVNDPALLSVY